MSSKDLTCFKTGWSILLDIQFWIKWLGILANLATIAAVIVGIIAAWIAFRQIKSSAEESKRSTANQIYQQYLLLCFENPSFTNGLTKPSRKNEKYSKYCWFISTMLFSFEQILEINSNDSQWIDTIESQLVRHAKHLKVSSTVRNGHWDERLNKIIKKVLAEQQ
ncbi:hypothetical protein IBT47_01540 [Erwinia sp. S43]|uniref:hypothetical protein n=1 Tax=Erwinia sp. S43 TaxID=2769339 RepID=UPI00190BFC70|nr:hypothetical protein [Erwinia sp. S43]MBK0030954.1 hypothetical protein [Erwinia sp. S43]